MCAAISCLDTRYSDDVSPLIGICDEFSYYRNRILVEIKYFIKFTGITTIVYNPLTDFTQDDYKKILELEKILKHDVKAIEYFIKDIPEIKNTNRSHLIHIGLTSQDICSIGFMLCFTDSMVIIAQKIIEFNIMFNKQLIQPENCNVYMIGLTHGQPATPTNFRKEMLIYYTRLDNIYNEIIHTLQNDITVKFGGATGEFNSIKLVLSDSEIDWYTWCDEFIAEFNTNNTNNTNNTKHLIDYKPRFKRSQYTNQCDNYDSLTKVLYQLKRLLHILEHLRGNIWLYIQRDYFIQHTITTEIGSSTMPNKVNPIDIENSKTAIEMAKRMIDGICDIISETSYQRDLSDSSAIRNISSVFGYILIAFTKLFTGISRLSVNNVKIQDELHSHPEVILEGIQTYLKYYCNITDSYEQLKNISRGKNITLPDIHLFIDNLNILEEHKIKLKNITPHNYIGYDNF